MTSTKKTEAETSEPIVAEAAAVSEPRVMSEEHKAALMVGRDQSRTVKVYLEALETYRPRRGRKRTPASIETRLEAIETALVDTDALTRLTLIQERLDLQTELATLTTAPDISDSEQAFVKIAKEYGERKGISYAVWREVGVDPSVLKEAGIARSAA